MIKTQYKTISFTIPGEVVPQGRPRATRQGGFVRMYQPATSTNFQNLVKLAASTAMNGENPIDEAFELNVIFYLPIPKNTSKKKTLQMLNDEIKPIKKPDLDNAIKGVMDGMTDTVWNDDKQVVLLGCEKHYSKRPRTEVVAIVIACEENKND